MPRLSPYIKVFFIVAVIALQACGPSRLKPSEPEAASGSFEYVTTGATREVIDVETQKSVTTNYTIAGSRDIFEKLQAELNSKTDQFLAFSVKDIRVVPLSEASKPVREKPERIEVQVDFKHMYRGAQTELVFKAKLNRQGDTLLAENIRQEKYESFSQPYSANIKCYDLNCQLVEVRLRSHAKSEAGKQGEVFGQIAALFSLSYPSIEVQRSNDDKELSNVSLKELEKIAAETIAIKTSVVIVKGPSFTRIVIPRVQSANTPESKPENIFEIKARLTDTADATTQVKSVILKGDNTVSAKLVGNDPDSGSLMFDVTVGKEEPETPNVETNQPPKNVVKNSTPPAEHVRIILYDKDVRTPVTPVKTMQQPIVKAAETPRGTVRLGEGLFQTSRNNKKALEMASAFAGYSNHPRVQTRVAQLLKERSRFVGLFSYAPNVTTIVENVSESLDLTPEIGYILDIESPYLQSGDFIATAKNKRSSAFGPWQIMDNTATAINDYSNITFIKSIDPSSRAYKKLNAREREENARLRKMDDRTYFLQSTYMAANYFKLMTEFHSNDPALAVLAYHAGPGNANGYVSGTSKPLRKKSRFNTTFATLSQFNMRFESIKDRRDFEEQVAYVFTFLALREIGQNPDKYSLNNIAPVKTEKYKTRLSRPNGPAPTGIKI